MTDALGLAAYLLLPLAGIGIWSVRAVGRETLGVRITIAAAAGALAVSFTMTLLTLAGIRWSRTSIVPLLVLCMISGIVLIRRARPASEESSRWNRTALTATAFVWLLTLYGTATARESCGDLHFTWGTKAIRWFRAGGLDAEVLRTYPQLTTDYPPGHTLLLAWSNTVSHQFSWWAAVLTSPLFLLGMLIVIRAWSRDDWGTLLVGATLTWTYTLGHPAGCAEPMLLLFETIAIAALTFCRDPRAQTFYAAFGAAGAVWTKLEGTTFAIALVLTALLVQRNWRRAVIIALPAAAIIGSWMTFVFRSEILLMYGGAKLPIQWQVLPTVLRTLWGVAEWNLYWLPWLVPIVLVLIGNVRRAAIPLSVAFLTAAATVSFYLRSPDPVWWIESSSTRVLLTPLLALLLAAVAAREPRPVAVLESRPDGVVP
jgi:hypothetical protein